jgi:hypothetical protein
LNLAAGEKVVEKKGSPVAVGFSPDEDKKRPSWAIRKRSDYRSQRVVNCSQAPPPRSGAPTELLEVRIEEMIQKSDSAGEDKDRLVSLLCSLL